MCSQLIINYILIHDLTQNICNNSHKLYMLNSSHSIRSNSSSSWISCNPYTSIMELACHITGGKHHRRPGINCQILNLVGRLEHCRLNKHYTTSLFTPHSIQNLAVSTGNLFPHSWQKRDRR